MKLVLQDVTRFGDYYILQIHFYPNEDNLIPQMKYYHG